MARARSTRRFTFAAGHRYWVSAWSPENNDRVYVLDVTVQGEIDDRTGMVIDLSELKRVVGETVVDRFDHADLNADPLFRDRVPTTENIALAVWELLAPKLGGDRLASVRVWEDATLWVDYDGA
jgi:6-pyruvoyltetrahydropterin/6-carboxytetrahydropterin synthase